MFWDDYSWRAILRSHSKSRGVYWDPSHLRGLKLWLLSLLSFMFLFKCLLSCSASQTSPPELTCASQEKAALPAAVARRPSLLTWTSAAHRPAALAMRCCRHTDLSYFLRIFSGWSVCLCVFMRVCECVRVYVCVCVHVHVGWEDRSEILIAPLLEGEFWDWSFMLLTSSGN